MVQLKSVTTGGLLKDVNDNFTALVPSGVPEDGLNNFRRTAIFTFDAGVAANKTVAAHAASWKIPIDALVIGGVLEVIKAFTGEENATLAVSIQSANDIVAAAAVSGAPWSTLGRKAILVKANTPESGIKLSADRAITFTVGTAALTAGKAILYLDYYEGLAPES